MAPFRPPLKDARAPKGQKHDEDGQSTEYGARTLELLAGALSNGSDCSILHWWTWL